MRVLIFQHQACEGPGYLAEVLRREGLAFDVVRVDRGEPVRADLTGVAGLVFMGGPMSVNDPLPWVARELELIRGAAGRGLPVLGHCLGGQLIAKALGAEVTPMGFREIGWHPVEQVPSPATEDWLGTLPPQFPAFHWHGEAFGIPSGASRLLQSSHCANQAFALDNILALQCHVEMTPEMVREWTDAFGAEIAEPSATVQSAEHMLEDLDGRVQALNRAADALYARWLGGLAG